MLEIEERKRRLNERVFNYQNSGSEDEEELKAIKEEYIDIHSEELLDLISVDPDNKAMAKCKL